MATVPTPRTWTVGELLTAAKLNTDLRNGLNFLLSGKPLAILGKTGNQTIPNSAWTTITWNSETVDRDAGHDNATNNSRYTAQTAGYYRVVAALLWNSGFTAKIRQTMVVKNASLAMFQGTGFGDADGSFASSTSLGTVFLAVSDYLEVQGMQATGSSWDVVPSSTRFELEWVSS
ncbi:hypothetical protein [Nonomuraea sp. NPDC049400]|uniref:hypothetical protein n=1 Tax=Nonomuraea sp. NPDC049400 TaxID=3364352 RepID=UPI0037A77B08